MKKLDWLIFLLIIAVSIVTLKDLFRPGFYTSHDGSHQIVRFYYFDKLLVEGQIPPRWVDGLLNGYGYPLFVFSYHLPWIITEFVHLFGLPLIESIKMTFLIGYILSGLTMYIFQKSLFGRLGAIVGTVLYLYAPYRFSNIFVRASIGDATTFIFIPVLFLSLYKLKNSSRINPTWVILGGLSFASILLSHAMVFFLSMASSILYIIYSLFFLKKKKTFIVSSIFLILVGFGLSSYYLIPSIIERDLTKFSEIIQSVYSGSTFLSLEKLWYTPWGYGTVDAKEGGMSLQLGASQWLVVFLSIAYFVWKWGIRRRRIIENRSLSLEAFFYLLLFLLSVFMMLPYSKVIWSVIDRIIIIDFTWRILPITLFSVSMTGGFLVAKYKYSQIIAILIIVLALYGNRNHLKINQVQDWPVSFYLKLENTTNSYDEYMPKWVNGEILKEKRPKVEFLNGLADIKINQDKSNSLEFTVDSSAVNKVRVNQIYYPGWSLKINGQKQVIKSADNGLIEFPVNGGMNKVELKFQETGLRLVSDLITFLTICFIVIYVLINFHL